MDHDQLFKELLTTFFREFMEPFYPDVAAQLDWSTQSFLTNEVFTDFPEGRRRSVDLVARLETTAGDPELVLLHVEVESSRKGGFGRRMFQYYTQLRWRHDHPVLPIALLLVPGGGGITEARYDEALFGRLISQFTYLAISLPDLDGARYRELENPVAISLAALMTAPESRARHKWACVREVVRLSLDEARTWMLMNVIDRYIPLGQDEEEEFEMLIETLDNRSEGDTVLTWSERLLLKGRLEGKAEGKAEVARKLVRHRFDDSPGVLSVLDRASTEDDWDRMIDHLMRCETAEEFIRTAAHG